MKKKEREVSKTKSEPKNQEKATSPKARDEEIGRLREELERAKKEIEYLKGLLRMNSENSSLPPSSDKFKKNAIPGSQRGKSGKKPGGQVGHKGFNLKPVAKPDVIVNYPVNSCSGCDTDLLGVKSLGVNVVQVFDLPEIKIKVTEHRFEVKACPCCETQVQAQRPAGVSPGVAQYGVNLKGFALYLLTEHFIPSRRVCEILEGILGHACSIGSIINWSEDAADALTPFKETLIARLIAEEIVHFDETGMRAIGKRQWLHSASTDRLSFFGIHDKRGVKAMDEFQVLPNFKGIAIHDHYDSYFTYEDCLHALCNSHILRELKFLYEESKEAWAKKMSELLCEIHASVELHKGLRKLALPVDVKLAFLKQYEMVLKEGYRYHEKNGETYLKPKRGRTKQAKGKNLLDRLRDFNPAVLRFMNDFRVPFTNNQAEQDIRMNKVKQKISGCFRSMTGAAAFCTIRSYFCTMKKQGQSVLAASVAIFNQQPFALTA